MSHSAPDESTVPAPRRRRRALLLGVAAALMALAIMPGQGAARPADTPPNTNDPCASAAGKDSCGTTGIGTYATYKFGTRWFGSYKGAIPGVTGQSFCIDLGYWYPGKNYGYVKRSAAGLVNRRGKAVSTLALNRMAYAIWQYGRQGNPAMSEATMLYVHNLMGDAQPGEINPSVVDVTSQFNQISSTSAEYAGPYTISASMPTTGQVGTSEAVILTVKSASGHTVPGVSFSLNVNGASGAPSSATSGSDGTATVNVTPSQAGTLTVKATANNLASNLPVLYSPTKGGAASSGQRLVVPASQSLNASTQSTVQIQPAVHTEINNTVVQPGAQLYDNVDVSGLDGQTVTVNAVLYGPYASTAAINCQGTPAWSGTVTATGDGTYQTDPVTVATPGYYSYVESIPGSATVQAANTTCADTAETSIVQGAPTVTTQVSDATTYPGAQLSDQAVVSGLGALDATVNVELWGPYASPSDVNCTGTPAYTGTIAATGDGTYTSQPATVPAAGYYTFQESIAATSAYPAVTTACADSSETSLSKAAPTLETHVSSAVIEPGSSLADHVVVGGLGKTPATVKVDLYGPFSSISGINCGGRPVSEKTIQVKGDGTVLSPSTVIHKAGFYVFRERMLASTLVPAVQTPCSQTAETSLGAPAIITGPGEREHHGPPAKAGIAASATPNHVSIPSLGVSAPIFPEAISTALGQVDVPTNIHDTGWWKDGAAPGDAQGTTLIFGHVDSAAAGAGAFYPLKSAAPGTIVSVTVGGGRVYRYRVTRVQTVLKRSLPDTIFTKTGPRRLVLVTCGGPFNEQTKHYDDNVIVYASPA